MGTLDSWGGEEFYVYRDLYACVCLYSVYIKRDLSTVKTSHSSLQNPQQWDSYSFSNSDSELSASDRINLIHLNSCPWLLFLVQPNLQPLLLILSLTLIKLSPNPIKSFIFTLSPLPLHLAAYYARWMDQVNRLPSYWNNFIYYFCFS